MENRELRAGNNNASGSRAGQVEISLPQETSAIDQDVEYCSVLVDGAWQIVRFHDYDEIYRIPGLYEKLFHEVLDCRSPDVIGKVLKEELQRDNVDATTLRVLDLGAGNGLIGEQLRALGAGYLVGMDILAEAAEAAERDRPGTYDAYYVADVSSLDPELGRELADARFNTLSCVAALGYGDIPPEAFRAAFNLIADGGWIAFTVKDRFLTDADTSGFARLIAECRRAGVIELRTRHAYRHRLDINGDPLHYVAIVATKRADIPAELVR